MKKTNEIEIKNGVQTYSYMNLVTGMQGIFTEDVLPRKLKEWKKDRGARVWLNKKLGYNIIITKTELDWDKDLTEL